MKANLSESICAQVAEEFGIDDVNKMSVCVEQNDDTIYVCGHVTQRIAEDVLEENEIDLSALTLTVVENYGTLRRAIFRKH